MICCLSFNVGQTYVEEATTIEDKYVFTPEEFDNLLLKLTGHKFKMDSLTSRAHGCSETLIYADSLIAVQDSLIKEYEDYSKPWWEDRWVERAVFMLSAVFWNFYK